MKTNGWTVTDHEYELHGVLQTSIQKQICRKELNIYYYSNSPSSTSWLFVSITRWVNLLFALNISRSSLSGNGEVKLSDSKLGNVNNSAKSSFLTLECGVACSTSVSKFVIVAKRLKPRLNRIPRPFKVVNWSNLSMISAITTLVR